VPFVYSHHVCIIIHSLSTNYYQAINCPIFNGTLVKCWNSETPLRSIPLLYTLTTQTLQLRIVCFPCLWSEEGAQGYNLPSVCSWWSVQSPLWSQFLGFWWSWVSLMVSLGGSPCSLVSPRLVPEEWTLWERTTERGMCCTQMHIVGGIQDLKGFKFGCPRHVQTHHGVNMTSSWTSYLIHGTQVISTIN